MQNQNNSIQQPTLCPRSISKDPQEQSPNVQVETSMNLHQPFGNFSRGLQFGNQQQQSVRRVTSQAQLTDQAHGNSNSVITQPLENNHATAKYNQYRRHSIIQAVNSMPLGNQQYIQTLLQDIQSLQSIQKNEKTVSDKLNDQLHNSKLFLSMVIHDMRSPTSSIQLGLQQTIFKLREIIGIYKEHLNFNLKCEQLQDNRIKIQNEFSQVDLRSSTADETCLQIVDKIDEKLEDFQSQLSAKNHKIEQLVENTNFILGSQEINESEFNQIDFNGEEDFGDCDEGVEVQNKSMKAHESLMSSDKKDNLKNDILKVLSKNGYTNDKIDEVMSIITEPPKAFEIVHFCDHKEEDLQQKMNFDREQKKLALINNNNLEISQLLKEQKQIVADQVQGIQDQMEKLCFKIVKQDKSNKLVSIQAKTQAKYYFDIFKKVEDKTEGAETLLQTQVYSQKMMENLINDMMDLAKLENNQFNISNDFFDLSSTIYEVFQMVAHQATGDKIELKAVIDQRLNLQILNMLYGDKRRFQQILLNFLSNSLKFTNINGSVTVDIQIVNQQAIDDQQYYSSDGNANCSLDKDIHLRKSMHRQRRSSSKSSKAKNVADGTSVEKYVQLQVSIIDTGVGMSPEGVKNLFVDFGKLKENEHRNKSGTGLGLSICKQIIEKMGGSVEVKSKLNVGTQFIINIKSQCMIDADLDKQIQDNQEKFIFIHKPNEETALVSCLDEKIQSNLKKAVDENEKLFTQFSPMRPVEEHSESEESEDDQIQSDVEFMAQSKKFEESEVVRQKQKQSKHHHKMEKLIFMSSELIRQTNKSDDLNSSLSSISLAQKRKSRVIKDKQSPTQSKVKKSAFSRFHEIIDYSSSSAVMESGEKQIEIISSSSKFRSKEASPVSFIDSSNQLQLPKLAEKKQMRCLIANDDNMSLNILEQLFRFNGFVTEIARNGHEAYEIVQETLNTPQEMFDLIVLDLNMPITNGYEACSSILKLYKDQNIFGVRRSQKKNKLWDLRPVIVACTSYINDYVIKNTSEIGFEKAFSSPLQVSTIQQEIIPLVQEREERLDSRNEISMLSELIGEQLKGSNDLFLSQLNRIQSNNVIQMSGTLKKDIFLKNNIIKKSKSNSYLNLVGDVPSNKEEKSDMILSNFISELSYEKEDQKQDQIFTLKKQIKLGDILKS